MSNQGSTQLNACKTELKNIIVGLEDIENHVRADYKNIGNIQCADSIRSVINKYQSALNTLNSVDASVLDRLKEAAEEAARAAARAAAARAAAARAAAQQASSAKTVNKMSGGTSGTIHINTENVRTTVTTLTSLNNGMETDFETVKNTMSSLEGCWEGAASNKAISAFNKLKSDFCGGNGRKVIMQNYIKFLSESVALDYEITEQTNTSLSDLFK